MSDVAAPTPDVTEMAAVHRVFRNALNMAPRLIGNVGDGDTDRAKIVGDFYLNVLEFLRVHHGGEDELLFPKLKERSEQKALVDELSGDHHAVERSLESTDTALKAWIASGSSADASVLLAELTALQDALIPHLDREEAELMPIVTQHITIEEWGELPGHAMGAFQGDNLFLILGLVREQMTQEQRDLMLEHMPPPAVEAWRSVGIDAFKGSINALIGAPPK